MIIGSGPIGASAISSGDSVFGDKEVSGIKQPDPSKINTLLYRRFIVDTVNLNSNTSSIACEPVRSELISKTCELSGQGVRVVGVIADIRAEQPSIKSDVISVIRKVDGTTIKEPAEIVGSGFKIFPIEGLLQSHTASFDSVPTASTLNASSIDLDNYGQRGSVSTKTDLISSPVWYDFPDSYLGRVIGTVRIEDEIEIEHAEINSGKNIVKRFVLADITLPVEPELTSHLTCSLTRVVTVDADIISHTSALSSNVSPSTLISDDSEINGLVYEIFRNDYDELKVIDHIGQLGFLRKNYNINEDIIISNEHEPNLKGVATRVITVDADITIKSAKLWSEMEPSILEASDSKITSLLSRGSISNHFDIVIHESHEFDGRGDVIRYVVGGVTYVESVEPFIISEGNRGSNIIGDIIALPADIDALPEGSHFDIPRASTVGLFSRGSNDTKSNLVASGTGMSDITQTSTLVRSVNIDTDILIENHTNVIVSNGYRGSNLSAQLTLPNALLTSYPTRSRLTVDYSDVSGLLFEIQEAIFSINSESAITEGLFSHGYNIDDDASVWPSHANVESLLTRTSNILGDMHAGFADVDALPSSSEFGPARATTHGLLSRGSNDFVSNLISDEVTVIGESIVELLGKILIDPVTLHYPNESVLVRSSILSGKIQAESTNFISYPVNSALHAGDIELPNDVIRLVRIDGNIEVKYDVAETSGLFSHGYIINTPLLSDQCKIECSVSRKSNIIGIINAGNAVVDAVPEGSILDLRYATIDSLLSRGSNDTSSYLISSESNTDPSLLERAVYVDLEIVVENDKDVVISEGVRKSNILGEIIAPRTSFESLPDPSSIITGISETNGLVYEIHLIHGDIVTTEYSEIQGNADRGKNITSDVDAELAETSSFGIRGSNVIGEIHAGYADVDSLPVGSEFDLSYATTQGLLSRGSNVIYGIEILDTALFGNAWKKSNIIGDIISPDARLQSEPMPSILIADATTPDGLASHGFNISSELETGNFGDFHFRIHHRDLVQETPMYPWHFTRHGDSWIWNSYPELPPYSKSRISFIVPEDTRFSLEVKVNTPKHDLEYFVIYVNGQPIFTTNTLRSTNDFDWNVFPVLEGQTITLEYQRFSDSAIDQVSVRSASIIRNIYYHTFLTGLIYHKHHTQGELVASDSSHVYGLLDRKRNVYGNIEPDLAYTQSWPIPSDLHAMPSDIFGTFQRIIFSEGIRHPYTLTLIDGQQTTPDAPWTVRELSGNLVGNSYKGVTYYSELSFYIPNNTLLHSYVTLRWDVKDESSESDFFAIYYDDDMVYSSDILSEVGTEIKLSLPAGVSVVKLGHHRIDPNNDSISTVRDFVIVVDEQYYATVSSNLYKIFDIDTELVSDIGNLTSVPAYSITDHPDSYATTTGLIYQIHHAYSDGLISDSSYVISEDGIAGKYITVVLDSDAAQTQCNAMRGSTVISDLKSNESIISAPITHSKLWSNISDTTGLVYRRIFANCDLIADTHQVVTRYIPRTRIIQDTPDYPWYVEGNIGSPTSLYSFSGLPTNTHSQVSFVIPPNSTFTLDWDAISPLLDFNYFSILVDGEEIFFSNSFRYPSGYHTFSYYVDHEDESIVSLRYTRYENTRVDQAFVRNISIEYTDFDIDTSRTRVMATFDPAVMPEIFATWPRFHSNLYFDDMSFATGESAAWVFRTNPSRFVQPLNVGSQCGIVSPEPLDHYTFEATLSSTNSDNDSIGLIIAFTRIDGNNYSLAAVRSKNGTKPVNGWGLLYIENNSIDAIYDISLSDSTNGWSGDKSRVKVVRQGDLISCYATDWNDVDTYDPASELSIDLDSDPRLHKFKGLSSYGYYTYSQRDSTYFDVQFSVDNVLYTYNLVTNVYGNMSHGIKTIGDLIALDDTHVQSTSLIKRNIEGPLVAENAIVSSYPDDIQLLSSESTLYGKLSTTINATGISEPMRRSFNDMTHVEGTLPWTFVGTTRNQIGTSGIGYGEVSELYLTFYSKIRHFKIIFEWDVQDAPTSRDNLKITVNDVVRFDSNDYDKNYGLTEIVFWNPLVSHITIGFYRSSPTNTGIASIRDFLVESVLYHTFATIDVDTSHGLNIDALLSADAAFLDYETIHCIKSFGKMHSDYARLQSKPQFSSLLSNRATTVGFGRRIVMITGVLVACGDYDIHDDILFDSLNHLNEKHWQLDNDYLIEGYIPDLYERIHSSKFLTKTQRSGIWFNGKDNRDMYFEYDVESPMHDIDYFSVYNVQPDWISLNPEHLDIWSDSNVIRVVDSGYTSKEVYTYHIRDLVLEPLKITLSADFPINVTYMLGFNENINNPPGMLRISSTDVELDLKELSKISHYMPYSISSAAGINEITFEIFLDHSASSNISDDFYYTFFLYRIRLDTDYVQLSKYGKSLFPYESYDRYYSNSLLSNNGDWWHETRYRIVPSVIESIGNLYPNEFTYDAHNLLARYPRRRHAYNGVVAWNELTIPPGCTLHFKYSVIINVPEFTFTIQSDGINLQAINGRSVYETPYSITNTSDSDKIVTLRVTSSINESYGTSFAEKPTLLTVISIIDPYVISRKKETFNKNKFRTESSSDTRHYLIYNRHSSSVDSEAVNVRRLSYVSTHQKCAGLDSTPAANYLTAGVSQFHGDQLPRIVFLYGIHQPSSVFLPNQINGPVDDCSWEYDEGSISSSLKPCFESVFTLEFDKLLKDGILRLSWHSQSLMPGDYFTIKHNGLLLFSSDNIDYYNSVYADTGEYPGKLLRVDSQIETTLNYNLTYSRKGDKIIRVDTVDNVTGELKISMPIICVGSKLYITHYRQNLYGVSGTVINNFSIDPLSRQHATIHADSLYTKYLDIWLNSRRADINAMVPVNNESLGYGILDAGNAQCVDLMDDRKLITGKLVVRRGADVSPSAVLNGLIEARMNIKAGAYGHRSYYLNQDDMRIVTEDYPWYYDDENEAFISYQGLPNNQMSIMTLDTPANIILRFDWRIESPMFDLDYFIVRHHEKVILAASEYDIGDEYQSFEYRITRPARIIFIYNKHVNTDVDQAFVKNLRYEIDEMIHSTMSGFLYTHYTIDNELSATDVTLTGTVLQYEIIRGSILSQSAELAASPEPSSLIVNDHALIQADPLLTWKNIDGIFPYKPLIESSFTTDVNCGWTFSRSRNNKLLITSTEDTSCRTSLLRHAVGSTSTDNILYFELDTNLSDNNDVFRIYANGEVIFDIYAIDTDGDIYEVYLGNAEHLLFEHYRTSLPSTGRTSIKNVIVRSAHNYAHIHADIKITNAIGRGDLTAGDSILINGIEHSELVADGASLGDSYFSLLRYAHGIYHKYLPGHPFTPERIFINKIHGIFSETYSITPDDILFYEDFDITGNPVTDLPIWYSTCNRDRCNIYYAMNGDQRVDLVKYNKSNYAGFFLKLDKNKEHDREIVVRFDYSMLDDGTGNITNTVKFSNLPSFYDSRNTPFVFRTTTGQEYAYRNMLLQGAQTPLRLKDGETGYVVFDYYDETPDIGTFNPYYSIRNIVVEELVYVANKWNHKINRFVSLPMTRDNLTDEYKQDVLTQTVWVDVSELSFIDTITFDLYIDIRYEDMRLPDFLHVSRLGPTNQVLFDTRLISDKILWDNRSHNSISLPVDLSTFDQYIEFKYISYTGSRSSIEISNIKVVPMVLHTGTVAEINGFLEVNGEIGFFGNIEAGESNIECDTEVIIFVPTIHTDVNSAISAEDARIGAIVYVFPAPGYSEIIGQIEADYSMIDADILHHKTHIINAALYAGDVYDTEYEHYLSINKYNTLISSRDRWYIFEEWDPTENEYQIFANADDLYRAVTYYPRVFTVDIDVTSQNKLRILYQYSLKQTIARMSGGLPAYNYIDVKVKNRKDQTIESARLRSDLDYTYSTIEPDGPTGNLFFESLSIMGDTYNLDLNFDATEQPRVIHGNIYYDHTKIDNVHIIPGTAAINSAKSIDWQTNEPGTLRFVVWGINYNFISDGTLGHFRFDLLPGKTIRDVELTMESAASSEDIGEDFQLKTNRLLSGRVALYDSGNFQTMEMFADVNGPCYLEFTYYYSSGIARGLEPAIKNIKAYTARYHFGAIVNASFIYTRKVDWHIEADSSDVNFELITKRNLGDVELHSEDAHCYTMLPAESINSDEAIVDGRLSRIIIGYGDLITGDYGLPEYTRWELSDFYIPGYAYNAWVLSYEGNNMVFTAPRRMDIGSSRYFRINDYMSPMQRELTLEFDYKLERNTTKDVIIEVYDRFSPMSTELSSKTDYTYLENEAAKYKPFSITFESNKNVSINFIAADESNPAVRNVRLYVSTFQRSAYVDASFSRVHYIDHINLYADDAILDVDISRSILISDVDITAKHSTILSIPDDSVLVSDSAETHADIDIFTYTTVVLEAGDAILEGVNFVRKFLYSHGLHAEDASLSGDAYRLALINDNLLADAGHVTHKIANNNLCAGSAKTDGEALRTINATLVSVTDYAKVNGQLYIRHFIDGDMKADEVTISNPFAYVQSRSAKLVADDASMSGRAIRVNWADCDLVVSNRLTGRHLIPLDEFVQLTPIAPWIIIDTDNEKCLTAGKGIPQEYTTMVSFTFPGNSILSFEWDVRTPYVDPDIFEVHIDGVRVLHESSVTDESGFRHFSYKNDTPNEKTVVLSYRKGTQTRVNRVIVKSPYYEYITPTEMCGWGESYTGRHVMEIASGSSPGPSVGKYDPLTDTGYYGFVETSQLISGNSLAAKVSLTAGEPQLSGAGWFKFYVGVNAHCNKTYPKRPYVIYVASVSYRYHISWYDLENLSIVYGDRIERIGQNDYRVRLIQGSTYLQTPFREPTDCGDNPGRFSEWNDLFYRIHADVPSCSDTSIGMSGDRRTTQHGGPQAQHRLPCGLPNTNWASYPDEKTCVLRELNCGTCTWTQDTDKQEPDFRVHRGFHGVATWHTNRADGPSWSSERSPDSCYGWRPVLELV